MLLFAAGQYTVVGREEASMRACTETRKRTQIIELHYYCASSSRSCTYCIRITFFPRRTIIVLRSSLRDYAFILISRLHTADISRAMLETGKAANPPFSGVLKNGGCRWPRVPLMDNSSRESPPFTFVLHPPTAIFFIILPDRRSSRFRVSRFPRFDLFISIRSAILSARNIDRCFLQPFRISLSSYFIIERARGI